MMEFIRENTLACKNEMKMLVATSLEGVFSDMARLNKQVTVYFSVN